MPRSDCICTAGSDEIKAASWRFTTDSISWLCGCALLVGDGIWSSLRDGGGVVEGEEITEGVANTASEGNPDF